MARFNLLWFAATFALHTARAQQATTTAVCGSQYGWMNNNRGQSPCLVAAYLQGACGDGEWTVPALPSTTGQQLAYDSPTNATQSLCTCSAAVYNLMSACAACQGGGWRLFAPWATQCTSANLLTLPNSFPTNIPVPSDTTIPAYAAKDPRTWSDGRFNLVEAQAIAQNITSNTVTSSTSSPTTASSSSTSPSGSSTSNNSNTGAIVGGVVGGVLGLALIAVLLTWLICGKQVQRRFDPQGNAEMAYEKPDVLGRAFTTPKQPSIIAPVPVRPIPTANFESYMSTTTGTSHHGDVSGYTHLTGTPNQPLSRSNTTSSRAMTLFRRVTSAVPWRSHSKTTSRTSVGSGTVMTSNVGTLSPIPHGGSDLGHGNVSRQNTIRDIPDPVPFTIPAPANDSLRNYPIAEEPSTSHGFPSAAEEKRRLNPPGYSNPPPAVVAPWIKGDQVRYTSQNPTANTPNSLLDNSAVATRATSSPESQTLSHHNQQQQQQQDAQRLQRPQMTVRPVSDVLSGSVPSNILLPSPTENDVSQGASSGIIDSSPLVARPPVPMQNMRFVVTNPEKDVEM